MSEALTHRRVLAIAIPIVLSNATVPILGVVDTGVVGQLGEAAPIGAVGIGAIILTALYWVFGFLRMGTTGLTSQAKGAKDVAEEAALLSRALLVGAASGVAIILLQGPLFALGFKVSPASAEVESLARSYMAIRVWSAPAAISLYGITGWLIAQERTRGVLESKRRSASRRGWRRSSPSCRSRTGATRRLVPPRSTPMMVPVVMPPFPCCRRRCRTRSSRS